MSCRARGDVARREAAGIVRALPLATAIGDSGVDIDGFEESPGREAKGHAQVISHGAFDAIEDRLVRGTGSTSGHDGQRARGRRQRNYGGPTGPTRGPSSAAAFVSAARSRVRRRPIVSVVADERHDGVTGIVEEKFFIPHVQWPLATAGSDPVRSVYVVTRTTGDPLSVTGTVRHAIQQMDAGLRSPACRR